MIDNEPRQKYLLLIEDNPDDELLIIRALSKNLDEHTIQIARNGEEAISFLSNCVQDDSLPEAVILDIDLPRKNGIEVLKEIRSNEKTRFLPVVMFTSSDERRDFIDSYMMGANSYVRKPVNYHEFSRVIQEIGSYWLKTNHKMQDRFTGNIGNSAY